MKKKICKYVDWASFSDPKDRPIEAWRNSHDEQVIDVCSLSLSLSLSATSGPIGELLFFSLCVCTDKKSLTQVRGTKISLNFSFFLFFLPFLAIFSAGSSSISVKILTFISISSAFYWLIRLDPVVRGKILEKNRLIMQQFKVFPMRSVVIWWK